MLHNVKQGQAAADAAAARASVAMLSRCNASQFNEMMSPYNARSSIRGYKDTVTSEALTVIASFASSLSRAYI